MTGIPAHLMCQYHRAWEAIFIIETCLKVLARGVRVIRELKLEGRFDLRLVKKRMDEIRLLDGGPSGIIVEGATSRAHDIAFPEIPYGSSDFLGYIHPNRHIDHLRRHCGKCRLLIDNDARTRGVVYRPVFIGRKE